MNEFTQEVTRIKQELTDADIANIKQAGLRVVCRPDNLVSIRELREQREYVEPLDAA